MDNYVENILAENLTLKRQLESKSEALVILNKELAEFKTERDQFKLMAERLQEKCSTLKKVSYRENSVFNDRSEEPLSPTSIDVKEVNRSLKFEVECLRQKLRDALGDVKALRTQLKEQKPIVNDTDSISIKHLDREEELVKQLEAINNAKQKLEIDLQSILDEKEELLTERDAYKCKVHRLNHELSTLLKGENHTVIDIDSLIMENRFLQEQLQQAQEEISLNNQTISRYKTQMERKGSKGAIKFGLENLAGMGLSEKQVQELLENTPADQLPNTAATVMQLRTICVTLLENVKDKELALSHQRRANRILAAQIGQLKQRVQNLQGSQFVMFPSKILLEGYTGPDVKNYAYQNEIDSKNFNEDSEKNDSMESKNSGKFRAMISTTFTKVGSHNSWCSIVSLVVTNGYKIFLQGCTKVML
ncbi:hypothetical protein RUM44_001114 [Polyplax serrata]|uniref:Uncharacterized protein n=1 Tax=Polyplax serrata TaxID=468196 RepID=A0ABR1B6P5_POLSC